MDLHIHDTDFIIRLVDQYPESEGGQRYLVAEGVVRMRWRGHVLTPATMVREASIRRRHPSIAFHGLPPPALTVAACLIRQSYDELIALYGGAAPTRAPLTASTQWEKEARRRGGDAVGDADRAADAAKASKL